MGKKDVVLERYFEDGDRYADLINGFVFEGELVVNGQDVMEKNSRIHGIFGKLRERFVVQKCRDAVRKVIFGLNFAIVGLEHQDEIHYAMPVRIMFEDVAGYDEQIRGIQRWHRKHQDLKGAEFLGRFAKHDRIQPVFTICIYYGKEPYDGPRELFQMMNYDELPDKLKDMVNNYKIHVLEVRKFQEIERFKTDLREVFGFIQRAGDKERERDFAVLNETKFSRMEEDAYDVITVMTGSKELEDVKEQYKEEGGKINMCEAIRGMIEDGRLEGIQEGIQKGIQKGIQEGKREHSETVARNMFLRGMSIEDTAAICEQNVEIIGKWFEEWGRK